MRCESVLLIACISVASAFLQQSVGVRGRLVCGDQPLSGATLKLINEKFGPNNQLAATKTDVFGNYVLSGGIGQIFGLDIKMKIYTSCNKAVMLCDREITLGIPGNFVTRTDRVVNWFNGGVLNMQFKFKDEETSCLH
ncbi:hypothetical protein AB6A40_010253 [Gnathostoma spinigerum]|uniref:Transthyretin-like family protein n=1 Tax=Gnathostoma spinigerum TaxID=75299 RepID=A0ABD6EZC6_9BILA